jgi:catechol 2,3-dioxygenase-like lactoylglutathione lyase family enzyme
VHRVQRKAHTTNNEEHLMIGYVTLGTDNLPAATTFFDELFSVINIPRLMEDPGHFVAWATAHDQPGIAVTIPWNKRAATPGNGTMVALAVKSKAEVEALHAKALALGGTDEGAPGPRSEGGPSFYAAYFRDLDGNKFNAFCMTQEN